MSDMHQSDFVLRHSHLPADPSGLASTTVYPSGSRSQISQWFGPPPPSGGLRCFGKTTSAFNSAARAMAASKSSISNHNKTPLPYGLSLRIADRPVMVLDVEADATGVRVSRSTPVAHIPGRRDALWHPSNR